MNEQPGAPHPHNLPTPHRADSAPPTPHPTPHRTLYRAAGLADAHRQLAPAALLVETTPAPEPRHPQEQGSLRTLAVGSPADLAALPHDEIVDLPDRVLLPGLVNAHAHLDLTHIGPRPYDPADGFVTWVDMVRRERRTDLDGIAASVRRGIELSLAGGTVAVGDIAGAALGRPTLTPFETLVASPLAGVSYLEFFGIARSLDRARAALRDLLALPDLWHPGPLRLGLQPHAPNTVDLDLFLETARAAAARGLPISTHLAETPEEAEFIARAAGPQRNFLERLGLWDPDTPPTGVGVGRHPIEHLLPALRTAPFVAAHVNDCPDAALPLLAATPTSVAYCPHASDYFGHTAARGRHRYADMLAAGINVCLGTDSIINLPAAVASGPNARISVLDAMRRLYARDAADPVLLLEMGTVRGARALGLRESAFRFEPGAPLAGLIAVRVDPWVVDRVGPIAACCLDADDPPELLSLCKKSALTGVPVEAVSAEGA